MNREPLAPSEVKSHPVGLVESWGDIPPLKPAILPRMAWFGQEFSRPRVIVVGVSALGHPAVNTFQRMLSTTTWPGPRDIFLTNTTAQAEATTYNLHRAKSRQGHAVIRVGNGGANFLVLVLDDADETQRVTSVFGPYESR